MKQLQKAQKILERVTNERRLPKFVGHSVQDLKSEFDDICRANEIKTKSCLIRRVNNF